MKTEGKRFFELIRDYLTIFLPLQKAASSNTVKSYRETWNSFLNFLCVHLRRSLKDISFCCITPDSIHAFLLWLETEHNCRASTLNHHLSAIRAFLKYAGIREPVYNDCYLSAGQVVRRKDENKLIVKHFDDAALKAILSQPNSTSKKTFVRYRCTGRRAAESAAQRYRD